ncbi:MAG: alpha-isopropylmalate synthase regulatory domain-containing protein [Oscillospiraceae bacterium]
MKTIHVVDVTLRENAARTDMAMSFKEKLEIAKQMDKLKVDVVELPPLGDLASQGLLVRSISTTLKNSVVSCPIGLSRDDADRAWAAISGAVRPRIHVVAPTSTVQMEYTCRMKPDKLLKAAAEQVRYCTALCRDIEFSAEDATRSDIEFLCSVLEAVIEAGATTVTICDSASAMLPQEFGAFIKHIRERVPAMDKVTISVQCGNDLKMAAANSFAAVAEGATQIKTAISSAKSTALETITHAIHIKGLEMGLSCSVKNTELHRAISQMRWMSTEKSETSPFDTGVIDESRGEIRLDSTADIKSVAAVSRRMGYELTDDDMAKVYDAFRRVAAKKQTVGFKEIEAIIASTALQAPPTYNLVSYVVNSGNLMSSTSHVVLEKNGKKVQGVCIGDGPIDASFLAIEQIIGRHYELDDFQIQAVTEGREAMGDAFVKLLANGKLYSGKGISTDIIGASIHAYINVLNKIAYEESNV